MSRVVIERFSYGPNGTFGRLNMPGFFCYTVERPWLDNKPSVSCIPAGEYTLRKRRSGVVERSSGREFLEGWEVCDVPGRTFIMIHPANLPSELEGCIAPGTELGAIGGRWAVLDSRVAFRGLMRALEDKPTWQLVIK